MTRTVSLTFILSLGLCVPGLGDGRGWERSGRNLLSGFNNMYQPHVILAEPHMPLPGAELSLTAR